MHGGWGFGQRNEESERFLEAAQSVDLFIANTGFKKREQHRVTYVCVGRQTKLDYIMVRRMDRKHVKDCKVNPD